MALEHGDLVLETTTTTGTGTLTLAGAVAGHLTFAAKVGEGNTCAYSIEASNGQKETGVGTVVGATLERTTLTASSTGSKLDLPAGTHYVGGTANSESFTPAAIGAATAAQGELANSAVQPGDVGTAAVLDVGTDAFDVVQLDATGKLPAVNGSQLTNLPESLSLLATLHAVALSF